MTSNNDTLKAATAAAAADDDGAASRARSEILKSEQVKLIAPSNGHALTAEKTSDGDFKSSADDSAEPEFVYREGGLRAWLVVIASGYCFGILVGLLNDYSLIYNQMIKDFNGTDNHVLYAGNSNQISQKPTMHIY